MEHREDRHSGLRKVVRAFIVSAATAATAVGVATLAPSASAAPGDQRAPELTAQFNVKVKPGQNSGDVSTQSTGSGSNSADFNGDGRDDILARDARNGQLKVYAHSGVYNGTQTFNTVTTINHGWGSMRWIGTTDINGDGRGDVVYVDSSNTMRSALQTGAPLGLGTLTRGPDLGTGWNINSLITTDDFDGDGWGDIIATRISDGQIYWYRNNQAGFFEPAVLIVEVTGQNTDVEMAMADITRDGFTDLLFVQRNGVMGVLDFETNVATMLSFGWEGVDAITVNDANLDGVSDILGRIRANGNLNAYTHTGSWTPTGPPDSTAFNTMNPPVFIGSGWHINNIIT